MLPEGWKLSCLGDACSGALQTGPFGSQLHAHEYTEHGVSVLMPKDLTNYRANVEAAAKISIEKSHELKRHQLKFGDILFSRRGDVARLALIDDNSKESLCGTGCLRARPSAKTFPGFLFFFLQLPTIKSWLEHNAVGQTMPNMNTEILYELPLILPPLPEQKKIAAVLSTWDRAIEGTEKLLANSQQQKKALMQQLLTSKKRLPGFAGEWRNIALGELEKKGFLELGRGNVISKKDIAAHPGQNPIYSSSVKNSGLMGTYGNYMFDEELISWSVDGGGHFFHRKKHKFSITNVSGYMRVDQKNLNYKFLCSQLQFLHEKLHFDYQTKAHPSVIRDLYILNIPPLPEQKAIAAVLSTADEEITAIESDLSRLRQEKKALMQQLLTGKRRVTVD